MTTATPPRLAPAPGTDSCRITVAGPARRVDLAVPATMTMTQLLPALLPHVVAEDERSQAWVLQRLGGEPLDAEGTAETLDLRDGDILYLRPATRVLPVMEFDDVAEGVADSVDAFSGGSGPALTRVLLLCVAGLALAAFAAGCLIIHPGWLAAPAFGTGAVVLLAGGALASRALGDAAAGVFAALAGCAFAALAGLSAFTGTAGIVAPGHREVLLAGALALAAAVCVLVTARVPVAPFGAVAATGTVAMAGVWLALAAHWDPARVTGLLAVVIFIAGARSVRMVLRAARLRVPLLPRTAEELQQDIEPEPALEVAGRTTAAIGYLDSLTISSAAVFVTASVLLAGSRQWAGWLLTVLLGVAVLLRARDMSGIWQRTALCLAGAAGIGLVLTDSAVRAPVPGALVLLAVLLAAAVLLLVGAGRWPGSRQAPVWGHLADQAEMVTALALVPVLLQVLHAYAYFRSLIG
jgi:type VII secretion integral membrane protein EccD